MSVGRICGLGCPELMWHVVLPKCTAAKPGETFGNIAKIRTLFTLGIYDGELLKHIVPVDWAELNQESKIIPIPSQNIPKTHRWRQFSIICGVGSMILQTLGPITFVLIHTIPTQSQHPDISVIVLQTWPDHGLQMFS